MLHNKSPIKQILRLINSDHIYNYLLNNNNIVSKKILFKGKIVIIGLFRNRKKIQKKKINKKIKWKCNLNQKILFHRI